MRFQNDRHDYDSDPYFYTAPDYRYNRGGATTRRINIAPIFFGVP